MTGLHLTNLTAESNGSVETAGTLDGVVLIAASVSDPPSPSGNSDFIRRVKELAVESFGVDPGGVRVLLETSGAR